MTNRGEKELFDLKLSLEKLTATTRDDVPEQEIMDILKALNSFPITIDLLQKTKIGQTLLDIKKSCQLEEVVKAAKALLSKWKKNCHAQAAPTATDSTKKDSSSGGSSSCISSTGKSNEKSSSINSGKDSVSTSPRSKKEDQDPDDGDEPLDESIFQQLTPMRRKIMDLFSEHFKGDINANIAKILSFNIEASVHKLHNADRDSKGYISKARSLSFNLKKNERLRMDIIQGVVQASHVAYLSSSDLATADIKEKRENTAKELEMARRGDLYEISRNDILRANGIDPNAGGEFICRKCKGTKCTHYSMQTRSSDEPMTVFVCCLTCGKRWRE